MNSFSPVGEPRIVSSEAKVKNIVIEDVHTIRSEASVLEAASLMLEKNVGCLVVMRQGGAIGMVTERDMLRMLTAVGTDPSKIRVKEIMSVPLIATTMDTSIGDAAKKMIENNIRRLVVLGEEGTFFGLVTMTDIVRWLARQEELSDSLINYLAYNVP
ncbi:MAG: CBS domain-containing protein [Thaumarchaeota archaeon]|nr:CBS domain-containing protein [Nitrososphaerota archaeon]